MSGKDLYTGLGKTLGDNLEWKYRHEKELKKEKEKKMKQDVYIDQKLNEINHDYQRMRKLAKKRRIGVLNRANKMRAKQEKELRSKLGGESWVEVKGTWLEKVVWVLVGVLLGSWFL